MEEMQPKYNNLFTIEERKRIIAQTMGELRKAKGLSQKEVAAEVGISQATYSAYERGRSDAFDCLDEMKAWMKEDAR